MNTLSMDIASVINTYAFNIDDDILTTISDEEWEYMARLNDHLWSEMKLDCMLYQKSIGKRRVNVVRNPITRVCESYEENYEKYLLFTSKNGKYNIYSTPMSIRQFGVLNAILRGETYIAGENISKYPTILLRHRLPNLFKYLVKKYHTDVYDPFDVLKALFQLATKYIINSRQYFERIGDLFRSLYNEDENSYILQYKMANFLTEKRCVNTQNTSVEENTEDCLCRLLEN